MKDNIKKILARIQEEEILKKAPSSFMIGGKAPPEDDLKNIKLSEYEQAEKILYEKLQANVQSFDKTDLDNKLEVLGTLFPDFKTNSKRKGEDRRDEVIDRRDEIQIDEDHRREQRRKKSNSSEEVNKRENYQRRNTDTNDIFKKRWFSNNQIGLLVAGAFVFGGIYIELKLSQIALKEKVIKLEEAAKMDKKEIKKITDKHEKLMSRIKLGLMAVPTFPKRVLHENMD